MRAVLMREGNGLTQDNLSDLAADLNRKAREGRHQPITMPAGKRTQRIMRAWVEGGELVVEMEEVPPC